MGGEAEVVETQASTDLTGRLSTLLPVMIVFEMHWTWLSDAVKRIEKYFRNS
jgi:hypothetical protein